MNKKAQPATADCKTRQRAEFKKILTLMNKALVSTSLKEKNDILNDVWALWTPQSDRFESLQKVVNIKNDELTGLRKQLATAMEEKDTLERNTSFYTRADLFRRRHSRQAFEKTIRETESEIEKHHAVQFPHKLPDALKIDSLDHSLFTLLDLNLHRLEELTYAFKKRLYVVEQSQDSTEEVLRDYGSINDLIEKVRVCNEENMKLKAEEAKFMNNPITRRRKFAEMTTLCSREFGNVFKRMLLAERRALKELGDLGYEEVGFDIDKVVKDASFGVKLSDFEYQEFGNTTEPELIAPIVEGSTPEQKIEGFKNVFAMTEKLIEKLENEIKIAKEAMPPIRQGSLTRVEKLMDANERLIERVSSINKAIDEKNSVLTKQADELIKVTAEKEALDIGFIRKLHELRQLMNDHVALVHKINYDKDILSSLYHVVSSFGKDILDGEAATAPLGELLVSKFGTATARLAEKEATDKTEALRHDLGRIEETESISELLTPGSLHRKLLMHRRKKRVPKKMEFGRSATTPMGNFSIELDDPRTSVKKMPLIYVPPKLLYKRPRFEVLHGLSVASELAGFVKGVDKPFKQNLDKFVKSFLSQTVTDLKAKIDAFGDNSRSELNQVNMLSNAILVKEKEQIAVQTDVAIRVDEECQTTEQQQAQKAKSRKK